MTTNFDKFMDLVFGKKLTEEERDAQHRQSIASRLPIINKYENAFQKLEKDKNGEPITTQDMAEKMGIKASSVHGWIMLNGGGLDVNWWKYQTTFLRVHGKTVYRAKGVNR